MVSRINFKSIVLTIAFALVTASCGDGSGLLGMTPEAAAEVGTTIGTIVVSEMIPTTSTTTTTTTTSTTTTTVPMVVTTTTTTFPVGLGVEIVGEEQYGNGVPMYISDFSPDYTSPEKDWLDAVGFNLTEGTEIRAPFDGYVSVGVISHWDTFWGTTESRVAIQVVTEPDEERADLWDSAFLIETTLENVRIPWGTNVRFTPIAKGDVIVVVTDGQEELPFRVDGQTMFFVFGFFDEKTQWYNAAPTIVWEFFPYVSAGEPVRPS